MALIKAKYRGLDSAAHNLVLISTATASSDSEIEFDLDSTYDHYIFRFSKIHPSGDNVDFRFDVSLTSDSDYGSATLTYILVRDYKSESSGEEIGGNAADSTGTLGVVNLAKSTSGDTDHSLEGTFEIYNPSSTTFTKGFRGDIISVMHNTGGDRPQRTSLLGDIRNTTAVDKIKFFYETGNIDSGTITQYGVKT